MATIKNRLNIILKSYHKLLLNKKDELWPRNVPQKLIKVNQDLLIDRGSIQIAIKGISQFKQR